jgi:hypothetical protein
MTTFALASIKDTTPSSFICRESSHMNNRNFALPGISTLKQVMTNYSPNVSPATPSNDIGPQIVPGDSLLPNKSTTRYLPQCLSVANSPSSPSSLSPLDTPTCDPSPNKCHKFVEYIPEEHKNGPHAPKTALPKAKRGKKVIPLTEEQLRNHFIYPQPEAARRLGVSLSTLKRRFYELHSGKRWPYNDIKNTLKKRKLRYIVNDRSKPEKYLDQNTLFALSKAFHQCTLAMESSPISRSPELDE